MKESLPQGGMTIPNVYASNRMTYNMQQKLLELQE